MQKNSLSKKIAWENQTSTYKRMKFVPRDKIIKVSRKHGIKYSQHWVWQ